MPFRFIHLILLLCLGAGTVSLDAQADTEALTRITVTVADLDRTETFYRNGLGFQRVARRDIDDPAYAQLLGVRDAKIRSLVMRLGSEEVEFQQFDPPGRAYPADSRSPDLWFQHFAIIVADMEQAYSRLQRAVPLTPISEGGPVTLPPENGRVKAFKFRDPDGHPLELLHFPAGVGRPVWIEKAAAFQKAAKSTAKSSGMADSDAVFLGIDHSAIGVSDSQRSAAFYRDLIGLQQSYRVVNRGPTQQRLDDSFNAVVEITGFLPPAQAGPGVEFLQYRAPAIGRPAREDVISNDIEHVRLTFSVGRLDTVAEALFAAQVPMLSPGVVELDRQKHGYSRGLLVKDPDGHALMLTEP